MSDFDVCTHCGEWAGYHRPGCPLDVGATRIEPRRSSSSGFEPTLTRPTVEALGEVLSEERGPQLIRVSPPRYISRVLVVDKRVNRSVRLLVRAQAADDGTLTLQVDDE